ncbi:CrcB family protein [Holzapfeliella sp. He02]|uniref:Fluoride-specific ion channel FluC n=1 Tax=Holzapfeliella saturejae TaxID=3082953 RepID=A0ABU8SFL5_9LACO
MWFLVGLASGFGTLCRRNLTAFLNVRPRFKYSFLATMIINISGSFLLGIFAKNYSSWWAYPLLGAGLMGGYTTFSTFNSELVQLVKQRKLLLFVIHLLVTYSLGLIFVALGYWL